MLGIVVSRLPAVFQRLMLLDYQIGLNFASGMGLQNVGEIDIESSIARFSVPLCTTWIALAHQTASELCHIRRTYIHIRHSGRAWQPSLTRKLCLVDGSHYVQADTAVRPYAEDFQQKALVLGKLQYQSPNLCRGGLPRPPVVTIDDRRYRIHKSLTCQAQKNDACLASSSRVYQHSFTG